NVCHDVGIVEHPASLRQLNKQMEVLKSDSDGGVRVSLHVQQGRDAPIHILDLEGEALNFRDARDLASLLGLLRRLHATGDPPCSSLSRVQILALY
ncbi:hypothetical protein OJ252_3311, partial [Cryptosporidium canis]